MGRLGFRSGWDIPEYQVVRINEIATDADGSAHLLKFDSVPGIGIRVQKIITLLLMINRLLTHLLRESHLLTGRTAILLLKPLANIIKNRISYRPTLIRVLKKSL